MQLDTILNCDCLEGMKNIPDGSIDLIATDPPYRVTSRAVAVRTRAGGWSRKDRGCERPTDK
jgi:DNA modification methylase